MRLEWSGVRASTGWLEVGISSRGGGGSVRGRVGMGGRVDGSGGVVVYVSPAHARCVCKPSNLPTLRAHVVHPLTWAHERSAFSVRYTHHGNKRMVLSEVDFTLRLTTILKGWASFECGAQEGYPRSILLVARLSLHITCSDGRHSSTNPAPDSVRVRQFTTAE